VKGWRPAASASFTIASGSSWSCSREGTQRKQAATNGRKRGETEEGSGGLPAVDNGRWWVDKTSGEGPFYRRAFGGKIGAMAALARGVMQQGRAAVGNGCEREAAPAVCVNDTQCRTLVACG
jgi:hypothetical protein